MLLDFESKLSFILESDEKFKSAVAIVKYRQSWLLGLSTASDDRNRKWAFPGGGIHKGETPCEAAERECWEETGIRPKAKGKILTLNDKPGIAFIPCVFRSSNYRFKPNSEFSALGFFETNELNSISIYKNCKEMITKAKRNL